MTSLIDSVLAYQRLDAGAERLERAPVGLDDVISAGVEGAIELIGPGRAQFAVHAPAITALVDGARLAQAITHLIVDVAGVDAAGRTAAAAGDSTIVVAAARRGDAVRIDVRGPHEGGSPVHLPITRGIVERHGGVLQTHEVPGDQGGSAYVLEVPIGDLDGADEADAAERGSGSGDGSGGGPAHGPREHDTRDTRDTDSGMTVMPVPSGAVRGTHSGRPAVPGARSGAHSGAGEPAVRTPRPRRPADDGPDGPVAVRGRDSGPGSAIALPAGSGPDAGPRDDVLPTGRRRALREAGADGPDGGQDPHPARTADQQAGTRTLPTGRRARRNLAEGQPAELPALPAGGGPGGAQAAEQWPAAGPGDPSGPPAGGRTAQEGPLPAAARALPGGDPVGAAEAEPTGRRARRHQDGPRHPGAMPPAVEPTGHPAHAGHASHAAPAPAGRPDDTEARAISVRTLGQGVAFTAQLAQQAQAAPAGHPQQAHAPSAAHPQQGHAPQPAPPGRRRKLAAPQAPGARQHPAGPAQQNGHPSGAGPVSAARPAGAAHAGNPAFHPSETQGHGQAFAIGAPAEGSEGPEMLDGPGGAVEVMHGGPERAVPGPNGEAGGAADPVEEFSGPRRLLVWPEPDVSTRQALTDRGYRPVTVRSREEVDAQVAEYPAALFVDPLTGPITRTALQSLRAAAVSAEVPVLVTAGLGQATREAAYGADPAVLLKALAPRDSDQHPPRVLLVEGHQDIAAAFTATLERRGMQVAHAASEGDAAGLAAQVRPNLVVMDLMLVRRRRVGIVDWLRANGVLNHTPLVVYTSVDIDAAELPKLGSGETVLFLAERSTSTEVQGRIVDLLGKIGSET